MEGDVDLEFAEHGKLTEEELFEAAGILYDRIGELRCPRCGPFRARFTRVPLPKGLGLLARRCCGFGAFSLVPGFEDAWLSLTPASRPVMISSATMALEEGPGGEEDARAFYRAQMRDLLEGVARSAPCRHHGTDTKVRVDLVHRDDPFCRFRVTACCKEFERVVSCVATQFVFERSAAGGPLIFYPPA
jgi:hypothetical protein